MSPDGAAQRVRPGCDRRELLLERRRAGPRDLPEPLLAAHRIESAHGKVGPGRKHRVEADDVAFAGRLAEPDGADHRVRLEDGRSRVYETRISP